MQAGPTEVFEGYTKVFKAKPQQHVFEQIELLLQIDNEPHWGNVILLPSLL